MYKVIGVDGKEYGPVSAEQLREWIAGGRANGQSMVQAEGTEGWKPLAQLPEFAAVVPPPAVFVSTTLPLGVLVPPGTVVPSYLVPAILTTLCCCLPFGIPAIVYAAQVNSKLAAGDVNGAMEASARARMWCWIAFGTGVVSNIIVMLIGGMSGITRSWRM